MGMVKRKHPRIGVYVCHCGHNIGGVVDVEDVAGYAGSLPGVVIARDNRYTCSDLGQSTIAKDIRDYRLDRVVVASCSPRLHETAFREVLDASDLNPYLLEMVNIREQCSWVHPTQPEKATRKAKDLVRGAVARASLLEPIEKMKKEVVREAMVIGAGVAGIFSALYLARAGIKTYLIEKEPSIGGHMVMLDKTFPTLDCSLCILSPKMVDVKKDPNIELITNADVTDITGHVGNFKVTVRKNPRYVDEDKCVACGVCTEKCPTNVPNEFNQGFSKRKAIYIPFAQAVPNCYVIDKENCLYLNKGVCQLCMEACENNAIDFKQEAELVEISVGAMIIATGFQLYDAAEKKQYGYGRYDNVITNLDFERLISADGPTKGKIRRINDGKTPESVAFIQCVGSRDIKSNIYCSVICCMTTLKHAMLIREKYPDTDIFIYYSDMRTMGKDFEEFYRRVREMGVVFMRGLPGEIEQDPETGNLRIVSEDQDAGCLMENEVDMVVLAAGSVPSKSVDDIMQKLHLDYSRDGFIAEAHPKLRPADTNIDGVFIAGCAHFPNSIPEVVAQAGNAGIRVMDIINKDEILIEETTAFINPEKCTACGLCIQVCPYDAIEFTDGDKVEVVGIVCKGCGACVVACPSGAIQQKHFLDSQILAQIDGILEGGG